MKLLLASIVTTLAFGCGQAPAATSGSVDWSQVGHDDGESRYSLLSKINADNVNHLGLAWELVLGTNRGVEATPILVDGVLYVSLPWSDVIAVDARTGRELWRYDAKVPHKLAYRACCDVVNRGVAYWHGRIFVGTFDGRLVALDAKSGKVIFDVQTTDRSQPYSITGAPRVMKDKVLIGNGGSEFGVRGYVTAYDASTGKEAWRFYTVPGDPHKAFENKAMQAAAKTWTGTWWKKDAGSGGGTVWDSMAYDPDLNLAYVGTGNAAIWNEHIRSPGGGDNLYTSSILAINVDTGKLKWFYQTTPGDMWDYDSDAQMILTELEIGGARRKLLMQANKNGFFYVIDRVTGKLISAQPFAKVTWAKGIDGATGQPIPAEHARWGRDAKSALVYPSALGAHNWQPMSYSPLTGLVYIPTQDNPGLYVKEPGFRFRSGHYNTGMDFAAWDDAPPKYLKGSLLAWNPVAGKPAWRVPLWGLWNGGTLATAGNLVFQGTGNGKFVAYRADTGKQVWEAPAGSGIIAAPMTYELDGHQYVTVMVGWGGSGAMTGRAAQKAGVISYGRMLTFALGGKAVMSPTPKLPAPPRPPKSTAGLDVIKAGEILYQRECSRCHGAGAVGGGMIPDLRHSSQAVFDHWNDIVRKGVLTGGGMVSLRNYVSRAQSEAIRAYVIYRANEGDIPKPINVKPASIR